MNTGLTGLFKRWPLWAFWLGLFVLGLLLAINNSLTITDDLLRNQVNFETWEPYVWELTSFTGIFLLFFPAYWLAVRFPLFNENWPKNLLFHLAASVAFSLLHVLIMVGLRVLIYSSLDASYYFGDWSQELLYEYRKDVITYFVFVCSVCAFLLMSQTGLEQNTKQQTIRFKNKNGWHRLSLNDISTIEAGGNYVYFNVGSQVYPNRATMKQISEKLNDKQFIRVHRSFIVNVDHIKTLKDMDKDPCQLLLVSGKTVPVSRKYRQALLESIKPNT